MKYIAFDIETAERSPENDGGSYALGITCIGCYIKDVAGVVAQRVWHGAEQEDGRLADRMTAEECKEFVQWLREMQGQFYDIVTWNGLGFDFRVLAAEIKDEVWRNVVIGMTWNHLDPMFQMLCEKGNCRHSQRRRGPPPSVPRRCTRGQRAATVP